MKDGESKSGSARAGSEAALCDEALKEIGAIVQRHHGGLANLVLVVDDRRDREDSISIYTLSCCPRHKRELYEEATIAVEEQLQKLDASSAADTMPPPPSKEEMH